jgi:glycerol-3-phosphate dehydrogenase
MVRFAARHEYARTVEDVLARRIRLLFTDAALAGELAGEVGALLREETGADPQVEAFRELAASYLALPA